MLPAFWPRTEWSGEERPSPGHYPSACEECGLYKTARSWAIEPEFDTRPGMEGKPWALIVGQGPNWADDREGSHFVPYAENSAAAFLRPFLERLPFRYIIDAAALCYAGKDPRTHRDKAPTERQARVCSSGRLIDVMNLVKPRLIICLGAVAMRAVLGKSAPKSVSAAKGAPWRLPGTDRWVLVIDHPSGHKPKDGANLTPAYEKMFAQAERILREGVQRVEVKHRVISASAEAVAWARTLSEWIWVDIEDNHHKKDPQAATVWHPGARIICMSVTDEAGETTVLLPPALTDERVLDAVFRGRVMEPHNTIYELTGLKALTGFDALKVIKRVGGYGPDAPEQGNLPGLGDTLVKVHLPNQRRAGNSLKTYVQNRWGAEDWSQPIWEEIDRANAAITATRKWLRSYGTRQKERAQKAAQRAAAELQASLPGKAGKAASRRMSTLDAWILKDRVENASDFQERPESRPLGSANFGDVPLAKIVPYCAQDTYWPRRISREAVPQEFAEGRGFSWTAYELVMRTIEVCARVTYNGLPLDQERLEALDEDVSRSIAADKLCLMQQPVVRKAVLRTNVFQKAVAAGKPITGDLLLEACNPQAAAMRLELARETGVYDHLPKTKKNNPSVNKEILKILAGEGRPWERLSEYEKVWNVFRRVREAQDLRSKFLDELRSYCVDGRVRTDFKIIRVEGISRDAGSESGGGAITGRLSSRNPNLQNLKKDRRLRRLFRALAGYTFVEADYDRIEPVVLSVVANVAAWKTIFRRGLDLYMVIANDVYKLGVSLDGPDDVVNKRLKKAMAEGMRDGIKIRLLAIMYDESARSFAAKAGVSVNEVEAFFRDFYRAYPEIAEYKAEIRRRVMAGDPITNPFGRQWLFELPPRRGKDYEKDLARLIRQALNVPIQSTASDITCWKAWELQMEVDRLGWSDHIIPQQLGGRQTTAAPVELVNLVHDSVWSHVADAYVLPYARVKKRVLEDMSTLPFEFEDRLLRVTQKHGPTFYAAKDGDMVEFEEAELAAV